MAHGVIDNTVPGRTTGQVWLAGREEPLILSLEGDCWRDLAGTRLEFENPNPFLSDDKDELDVDQSGLVGDMSASRKTRVAAVGEREADDLYQKEMEIPFEWKNMLYLEWFSEINGRVVIETTQYQLSISSHEWEMDEDEEDAQKLANLNAMRDFMAQVIQRRNPEEPDDEVPEGLDEFAWEERLKESDRLTDAYQEVLEKYMEDADSERKEAFVMGWDGLLDALADREESGEDGFADDDQPYDLLDDDFQEFGLDDDSDESGSFDSVMDGGAIHPVQAKAEELAMRTMDVVKHDGVQDSAAYQLISSLIQVSAKLSGVLQGRSDGYMPETGFVLAVLKRCLNWLNEGIGACQILMEAEKDPDQLAALERIRNSTFEVRDDILELRKNLK